MKYVILFLIIMIRCLDLYLTFLLEGELLETEVSPIIVSFNGNWTALILCNVILIIGMSLVIFKCNNLPYLLEKEKKFDKRYNFLGYVNYLYFNSYHIKNYLTAQLDYKIFLCIFLNILPYIVLIQGLFAVGNNLSALFYDLPFIQSIPQNMVIHVFTGGTIIALIIISNLFLLYRFKKLYA